MRKTAYFCLTSTNLVLLMYFSKNNIVAVVSILSFLGNHYLLYNSLRSMLLQQKKSLRITAQFLLKFLILIGLFYWVMNFTDVAVWLIVISYIFQLLILVLSIKKENKI